MAQSTKQDLLQRAQSYQAQQDWPHAIDCYQQILVDYGEDSDIHHHLAILHAQQQAYSQAMAHIKQAIQQDDQQPAYWNSLGIIYLKQNQMRKAIQTFKKAIALKSDYAIAYNNLGKCYYHQQAHSAAEQAYRQALQYHPHYADAQTNLAICLTRQQRYDEAIEQLQKTIAYAPNSLSAYSLLAEIYLEQGQYAAAITQLTQCLQRDDQHEATWHRLGLAYLQTQQPELAVEALEQLLALNSNHPEANQLLAHAQLQVGDQEKALSFYFRQLAHSPSLETLFNIGVIMMNQQRHKDAIPYLKRVTQAAPDYLPAWVNLGAIYLKMQTLDKAKYCYQQAVSLAPQDSELKHILSALTEDATADKAPTDYTTHLFDQYARFYDTHLTEHLRYALPTLLQSLLTEYCDPAEHQYKVMDLGCGTGLCGPMLAPYADSLIGIDLSENMVAIARRKGCYQTVIVGDIEQVLPDYKCINLIVAADVLPYYGACDSLFQLCYDVLAPKGYFIFSFEKSNIEPYVLHHHIRYAHHKHYIQSCLDTLKLHVVCFNNCVIRQQYHQPVDGYLVMVQKT